MVFQDNGQFGSVDISGPFGLPHTPHFSEKDSFSENLHTHTHINTCIWFSSSTGNKLYKK